MVRTCAVSRSRAVREIAPFAHNAFEPHAAGVRKHGRAVAFDVLVEMDAKLARVRPCI
jgi:hypothetical protein